MAYIKTLVCEWKDNFSIRVSCNVGIKTDWAVSTTITLHFKEAVISV